MFYVKVLKDNKTLLHKSEKVDTIDKARDIMENFIMRANNYTDIKMLGNERVKIEKYNYDLFLEIVEE